MIPEVADPSVVGVLLPPKNLQKVPLVDWELGGVALSDPSQGNSVKVWKFSYLVASSEIVAEAPGVPQTPLLIVPGVVWLAGTFDQNMRPVLAWTTLAGEGFFYWYDPVAEGFVTDPLGTNVKSPHLFLDDKRFEGSEFTDVILTYIQNDELLVRVQRERFLINHVFATDLRPTAKIRNFGMSNVLRLQWEIR